MKSILILSLSLLSIGVIAQEKNTPEHRHAISFGLSHTNIFESVVNESVTWSILPSFLFDYDYYLSNKWVIGLHADLVVETFQVAVPKTASDVVDIEREFPIALVPVVSYKVFDNWALQLGSGIEIEKNENFALFRLGTDFFYEVGHRYEVFLNLSYDYRIEGYQSVTMGFGLKRFF